MTINFVNGAWQIIIVGDAPLKVKHSFFYRVGTVDMPRSAHKKLEIC